MISPVDKKCYHCDEYLDFIKDRREIYCIFNLVLERSPIDGRLHWRWVKPSDNVKATELYFHIDCFKKIAGEKYIK